MTKNRRRKHAIRAAARATGSRYVRSLREASTPMDPSDWSPKVPDRLVPVLAPIGAPPATWDVVTFAAAPPGQPWALTITTKGGSSVTVEIPHDFVGDALAYDADVRIGHYELEELWDATDLVDGYAGA